METQLFKKFKKEFQKKPEEFIRCGGRFEILGNHTDHNHGLCIAATCDMSTFSAVSKRDDNIVNVISEGYPKLSLNLDSLEIKEEEKGSSAALIRGVANYLVKEHHHIGGFDAYIISTIFPGAGVSSSASYELLIGDIFNILFNDNQISRLDLAKAGQYAENVYYGKSCGLLDQIGVSFGGFVYIDFKDINQPKVSNLQMNLKDHEFILVNTGGDHAAMSPLYSKIPSDMWEVAKVLGVNYLRESSKEELLKHKEELDGDKFLRACHFFDENARVEKAILAIQNDDIETLKECINGSRNSSTYLLKNMMANSYVGSPLEATDLLDKLTNGEGAAKINGGGFAGSIVCLIPTKYEEQFIQGMSVRYGKNNVYKVNIDTVGVGRF